MCILYRVELSFDCVIKDDWVRDFYYGGFYVEREYSVVGFGVFDGICKEGC